jgi:putative iron-regulated protein
MTFSRSLKMAALALTLVATTAACTLNKNTAPASPAGGSAGPEKANQTPRQRVIGNLANNVVLHTYKNLATRSAALHEQVILLKSAPTQANLDRACDLWRAARISWEQTESFLFGPVSSLNLDPKLDTWPTDISNVNRVLQSGQPITVATLAPLDTNLKGFHMIEFLLFGDGMNTNKRKPESISAREFDYLFAATEDLALNAASLAHAWEVQSDPDVTDSLPYVKIITGPNVDNKNYSSENAVIAELFNGIAKIADEVSNGKIAEPLNGDIDKIESRFSWNSASDFADNIRSVQMIYTGNAESGDGFGLKNLLEPQNKELADAIQAQIELSISKLNAIGESSSMSFRQALGQPAAKARIEDARKSIQTLFEMIDQQARPYFKD